MTLVLCAVGCSKNDDGDSKPASPVKLPKVNKTTKPDQAVEYIDYAIREGERVLAISKSWDEVARTRRQLLDALLRRAQNLGDLSALDRAVGVVDDMLAAQKEQPSKYLYQAKLLSALHRFDEAKAALDKAEAEGVKQRFLLLPKIRYLINKGQTLEALEQLDELEKRVKTLPVISTLAVTLANLGRIDAANKQFNRGLSAPTLVDPLPVVFLWFQQGLMYERQGEKSRARDYYNLAHSRFPYHPALNSHLAALEAEAGDLDSAIARVRKLTKQSDDPEYLGQLASLLREAGKTEEAEPLAKKAEADYEKLLAKYPLAFADHAARFYLDVVKKPERALELATQNVENRQTEEAYQLYLDAAHAAGKSADPKSCEIAAAAVAREHASAYALFAGARALRECGKTAEADAAMKRTKKAKRQR